LSPHEKLEFRPVTCKAKAVYQKLAPFTIAFWTLTGSRHFCNFYWAQINLDFWFFLSLDELVKSLLERHPGESRGPEHLEIAGFRLSPE
jgi:hypothetical protein